MAGDTFVDYVNQQIEVRRQEIKMMSTKHTFIRPRAHSTASTQIDLQNITAALIMAQPEENTPKLSVITDFVSVYTPDNFTVLALYRDYLVWLMSTGAAVFPVNELLQQLGIIARYQKHVLSNEQQDKYNNSILVSCPPVPEGIVSLADDCADVLQKKFSEDMKKLDSTVYDAVVKAVDDKVERRAKLAFYAVSALAIITLAAFAVWMGVVGVTNLRWVPGLLGGVGLNAAALSAVAIYKMKTQGRLTTKITSPEPLSDPPQDLSLDSCNYRASWTALKRSAMDDALGKEDTDALNKNLVDMISIGSTDDLKHAVTATTQCFIQARYASQYRTTPVKGQDSTGIFLKADNGNNLAVDLLSVQVALGHRMG